MVKGAYMYLKSSNKKQTSTLIVASFLAIYITLYHFVLHQSDGGLLSIEHFTHKRYTEETQYIPLHMRQTTRTVE